MLLLLRVAAITDRGSIVQGTDCKEGVFVHLYFQVQHGQRTTAYLSGFLLLLHRRPLWCLACKWHIKVLEVHCGGLQIAAQ